MPTPPPLTLAGRQVQISRPAPLFHALPRPHALRRHHWITVAVRRIAAEDTPQAVPVTQLLQACSRSCGQHRTRILPGHWQTRDLVHPAVQPTPQPAATSPQEGRVIVGDAHTSGIDVRAVQRELDRRTGQAARDTTA